MRHGGLKILFLLPLLIIGVTLGIMYPNIKDRNRDLLLSPYVFYALPSGGYIYIDGEYIRYNESEFDGILDYQITLNYTLTH